MRNAAVQVNNICSGLIQVDPANRDYYSKNRDEYLQKLKALDEELNQTFAAKTEQDLHRIPSCLDLFRPGL